MSTIFKKILDKELPAEVVYENEHLICIKDINPVAPVHLLIIPRKEITSIQAMKEADLPLMGEIIKAAQHVAKEFGVESEYRLLTNNGENAGQTVFHLHFHLVGGRALGSMA
ncbi:MAG: Purine nucleoside phosphoramidase [Chlamydiia bacterium]|nr:Purine nucleoside phosphoramidase [Chlamydiia bacterium]MCH9615350.1 Purine nucleoside phosphoramidase [Chlamydiia bacterium]MCH9628328.1 Purine nucleoside phosphoramidase [Chlamydiia bacterium]